MPPNTSRCNTPPSRALTSLTFTSRALLRETAGLVARGTRSTEESSRAKVFISEATWRIVDRAVQLAGGMGVTEDSVIGRIYADIRAFRIYDGPSEAHRASIARRALARAQQSQE
jgi:acyl-CoA dehydrogenase